MNMIMFLCAVLLGFQDFISSYKRVHHLSLLIVLGVWQLALQTWFGTFHVENSVTSDHFLVNCFAFGSVVNRSNSGRQWLGFHHLGSILSKWRDNLTPQRPRSCPAHTRAPQWCRGPGMPAWRCSCLPVHLVLSLRVGLLSFCQTLG